MNKKLIFVILCICLVRSDLFTCIDQIGATIPIALKVLDDVIKKEYETKIMDFIVDLEKLGNSTTDILNKCIKAVCKDQARQACEEKFSSQGCEQWGMFFYQKCSTGYSNAACCICNHNCPDGYRDDGAFCAKPGPYGRGAGYPWEFGDKAFDYSAAMRRCEKDNGVGNCEENGLIWYPKCKYGYHPVGCCICSPNCPSGWDDIGVSCTKPTYGRGVGFGFDFNNCQDMGHKYPFVISEVCNEKLEQMQQPINQLQIDFQNKNYGQALVDIAIITDLMQSYFEKCYDPKEFEKQYHPLPMGLEFKQLN